MQHAAMYLDWLRSGLARLGKSQRGLAEHLGVSESVVSRILSGEREIKARELARIASYIDSPVPKIGSGPQAWQPVSSIPVTLVAAAGLWRDEDAVMLLDQTHVPALHDPRFPGARQFAVQIYGARKFAICVDRMEAGRAPAPNDIVVAERINGTLRETTLRRVQMGPRGLVFAVLDHDRQPVGVIHSEDDISVVGFVLGFFEPL